VATRTYSAIAYCWDGRCTGVNMQLSSFTSPQQRFDHCYKNVLSYLYEYDAFMESVARVAGLGCDRESFDMQWWADATTRDEVEIPLNIKCTVISDIEKLNLKHKNISLQKEPFWTPSKVKKPFDILWAYDILQYVTNPYKVLANWWRIATTDSMLIIAVPQTTNLEFNRQEFHTVSNHKYHYTLPMLIYMLSVNGWDCNGGFFKKTVDDPWLYSIVYRSDIEPMDPMKTNLYNIAEDTNLLPECVVNSINKYGSLRQRDLVLPWIDKNLTVMENH